MNSPTTPTRLQLAAELRLVVGRLGRRLRQHGAGGLTPSQLSILSTLEQGGPLHMGELARREAVAPPTITRIVGVLDEGGLVARTANPDDARSTFVELTGAGQALLDAVRSERTALLVERLAGLDDAEIETLAAALPLLERLVEPPA